MDVMKKTIGKSRKCLKGLPLSGGYTVAKVCFFNENRHSNLPMYKVDGEGLEREKLRVKRAIDIAMERLNKIKQEVQKKIGSAEAEIFVVHKMILQDITLQQKILGVIDNNNVNAETAVINVLDEYEAQLQKIDNEYMRERSSDIGEIKRRLLDVLNNMNPSLQCGGDEHCQRGKNRIIVAEELTPTMAVELDIEHLMGFVTERGSTNSHAAILARALGVPAVSGLPGIRNLITCGTELLVNGNTGEVIIQPDRNTIKTVRSNQKETMRMPKSVKPVSELKVLANINIARDTKEAVEMMAEGVGLYRTEIEVIAAGRFLEEDELYERYVSTMNAMKGKEITYRLFDIGSDKPFTFMNMKKEENPSLGYRGSRLLINRKDILQPQARALARTSMHGPINVLYPMIIDLNQFLEIKRLFMESVKDINCGEIYHGVMFEVPSACLQANELMASADFGSIGTNDLIQYLFAVDRNNDLVAYDYNVDRSVLWELMQSVVNAAKRAEKSISVCGELAGDPEYLLKFIKMGINTVSVGSRYISRARMAVNMARASCKK